MQASVCQSFEEKLVTQVDQLSCLQLKRNQAVYLYEHQLELIFRTLYYKCEINLFQYREFSRDFIAMLEKLARICIHVIDLQETPNQSGLIEESHMECRIWAHKILILLVGDPFRLGDRTLLKMIYDSLVKKLQIPASYDELMLRRVRATRRAGLSAFCLARVCGFDDGVTPEEASKLITDTVLPLAAKCITREAKHERRTYQLFHDETHGRFHGLFGIDYRLVCNDESVNTYPLVIRLLSALTRRSGGSGSHEGYYLSKFESMLKEAINRGKTKDEDIIALNVLADHREKIPEESMAKMVMDLLAKSEGLHRAHILHLSLRCSRSDDTERFVMKAMIDDLATKNDELLNEIALWTLRDMQYACHSWKEPIAGKEIQLIDKLIDMNAAPDVYHLFLGQFSDFKDPKSSLAFDNLALRPISQAINKLHHWINLSKTHHVDGYNFNDCVKCLKSFVRLRKHRLDLDQEVRLNQVFKLIIEKRLVYNNGDYLVFANSFQVYPSAWESIIEVMRLALTIELPADYDKIWLSPSEDLALNWQLITNQAFAHLLLTDSHYFYTEIASSAETLGLIFAYSKRAVESGFVETLLKEILLTWPRRDHEKTKLNATADEHRQLMLSKFIGLLIDGFARAKKDALAPRVYTDREMFAIKDELGGDEQLLARLTDFKDLRQDDRMSELLFGLMAAFSFHRQALRDVLDERKDDDELELGDRQDSWLKENISKWTELVIGDGKQEWPGERHFYGTSLMATTPEDWKPNVRLDKFANVIIAYEALLALTSEGSRADPELIEESSSVALMEVIKLALQRGIERAPVGSLESKGYLEMRARLPFGLSRARPLFGPTIPDDDSGQTCPSCGQSIASTREQLFASLMVGESSSETPIR